jgi:hypothetical protein
VDRGLATLIGMSIAYAASLLGMALAYWAWRRRQAGGRAPGSGIDEEAE